MSAYRVAPFTAVLLAATALSSSVDAAVASSAALSSALQKAHAGARILAARGTYRTTRLQPTTSSS